MHIFALQRTGRADRTRISAQPRKGTGTRERRRTSKTSPQIGPYNIDADMKMFGEWNKGWQTIAAETTDDTKRPTRRARRRWRSCSRQPRSSRLSRSRPVTPASLRRAQDQMSKIGGLDAGLAGGLTRGSRRRCRRCASMQTNVRGKFPRHVRETGPDRARGAAGPSWSDRRSDTHIPASCRSAGQNKDQSIVPSVRWFHRLSPRRRRSALGGREETPAQGET